MEEKYIPKWQKELSSFIGISSGILLQGNVYDEYPVFRYENSEYIFDGTDNLEETIFSLVDEEKTEVVYFDPVDGFYTHTNTVENQRNILTPLFNNYTVEETTKDFGSKICMMPSSRKGSKSPAETEKYIWVSEIILEAMKDKDKVTQKSNIIFVINFASRLDACNIRDSESNAMFMKLMKAITMLQNAQNTLIMIVDKYNDIPAWVYMNNPNIRTVSICAPDRMTRRLYLENLYGELTDYKILGDDDYAPGKKFVAETEGMKLQELRQILQLAHKKNISTDNIRYAFRLYKYGVLDNPWENLENDILKDIEANLEKRVKGQKEALKKVKKVITRAVKGLSGLQHSGASSKPKGILFFAGPTGVGKTETAKAIAESIFGDENACIRFDMSEYRLEQSDQKLFGAPPGYVGYEGGGQLTNAVKNRPFSVILFDEIEKASPTILDKFLQILEDGRMTDNQGNTVYFGETIIIFTSNIGLTKEIPDEDIPFSNRTRRVPTITIEDPTKEDTKEFRQRVWDILTNGVKDYFTNNGRPELLNRLGEDNIVVFQFINVEDAKSICIYKLDSICETIEKEKGIKIDTTDAIKALCEKAVLERANGGRGVGNMLEREFLNPFAAFICDFEEMPSELKCYSENGEIKFRV